MWRVASVRLGRLEVHLKFAGVDWGSRNQACAVDTAGSVLGGPEFEHGDAVLSQMAGWLLWFATGDADKVGVATEISRGSRWGAITMHSAVSVGWLRSPAVRAQARS